MMTTAEVPRTEGIVDLPPLRVRIVMGAGNYKAVSPKVDPHDDLEERKGGWR